MEKKNQPPFPQNWDIKHSQHLSTEVSLKSLFCRSVSIPQILLHTNSSADISISENSKSFISGLEPLKVLPFPVWNISDHPQKWRAFKSHHRDAEIVTWKLLSLWTCKSCFPVHQNSPRYPASMEKVKGFWNYVLVFRLFFSEQKFLTVYKNGNFNTVSSISNSHLCIYERYSIHLKLVLFLLWRCRATTAGGDEGSTHHQKFALKFLFSKRQQVHLLYHPSFTR